MFHCVRQKAETPELPQTERTSRISPSREDFLDAIDDGDFSRRDSILELMVVSSSKELWTTFMEYLKSNKAKDVNLRINWPGLAHLAIFVRERTHFEIIHNACKYSN